MRRSESTGLPSARHRVTLPANTPMSKRPRPEFDPIWAVRGDGEDDFGEALHIEGKKLNFGKQSKDSKDHLDDWDTMLMGSSLADSSDPMNLMNSVKAFFITSGFLTPHSTVGISERLIDKLLNDAETQDPDNPMIFAPHSMREEVGIPQAIATAKEFENAEWHVMMAADTVASNGGEENVGILENSTFNALSMLGASPHAMKVIQSANADKVKPLDIPKLLKIAKT